eukprot:6575716-Ditylum_brightwellii.AAC.1
MSEHKVSWSSAPNFAYSLVARKFNDAKEKNFGQPPIENLDVSSIIALFSGAEPIQSEVISQFNNCFKQYGLAKNWFVGTYGMAKMVVAT